MKTALLVIDIQKDYFPGGKMELVNPLEAGKKAYSLLQCFREHGGHHVHIQHIALKPDAPFFVRGTEGSDIHDVTAHFEGEPIVYKHYPNSFPRDEFIGDAQRVGCGACSHYRYDDPHVRGCDCPCRR
jgi:nicotinamidase-related amidase